MDERIKSLEGDFTARGLKFGIVHTSMGHEFSNAKDPAGNSNG